MDKIIVRANTDMQRVIDWSEKLTGAAIALPFATADIEFQEELITLRFRDEGSPIVAFEMFFMKEGGTEQLKIASWKSNLEDNHLEDLKINVGDPIRKAQMSMILAQDNTIWKCVSKFKALMLFATYYREDVERTKTVHRTTTKRSKGGKRNGSQRKSLTIRRYTISNSMLEELPAPKKEWHGYKSTFSARGHYRKTKTGKVIWVRPYSKKGIADKKTDREFIL